MNYTTEIKEAFEQTKVKYENILADMVSHKEYIEQQIENVKGHIGCLLKNDKIIKAIDVVLGAYADTTPTEFVKLLCTFWDISTKQLFEKNRVEEMVCRRMIAAKLLRMYYPKNTLTSIGKHFGQDHTTIMCLLRNFDKFYGDNNKIKFIEAIEPVSHFFIDITKNGVEKGVIESNVIPNN